MSRSFTGCKRCKQRRQKCDEKKPECGRCKASGSACSYSLQLQWGGRAFSRSRFGVCVGKGGGMHRVEYSPGEFIYTITKDPGITLTTQSARSSRANTANAAKPESVSGDSMSPIALTQTVDPFYSLSSEQKALLHHFINDASQITACHSGMQRDICRMLIPMALQTPSLLHATTALSAIHLQALNNHSDSVKSAPDIARLMALSLEHFRNELRDLDSTNSDALLATARTLCLAEIHSGAVHPNTWRAHVEGAKALMSSAIGRELELGQTTLSDHSFRRYLDRWYRSIASLTALTGGGPPISATADEAGLEFISQIELVPDYLDDYWGFTVHLSHVFRAIGAAAWRKRHHNHNDSSTLPVVEEDRASLRTASLLEASVRRLMDTQTISQPTFYPGVVDGLSAECIREFVLCNEAFQHSALIQINRRLRDSPGSSADVQQSVKKILECTSRITPSTGLSPWTMLTTPLFIAGCEAHGEDRETVRELLGLLHDTIRVPNVLQSLKFLEQYWMKKSDEDEDWGRFLDRMQFDFIPY